MDKAKALQEVTKQMERDVAKLPLVNKPTDIVPSEGNPEAQVMFIGEAAGYHESVQRRPFVGAAGQLLNKTLEEVGLSRKDVFIANVVRCRPPENRDPLPSEIAAYAPYLDKEIAIIKPKIIATLGRFSMGKFLPDARISQVHGQARWIDWQGQRLVVMPMYHPAAALRAGEVLRQFKADFGKLKQILATINNQPVAPESNSEENGNSKTTQLSLI